MAVINHSNYSSVHMSVKNQNIDSTATQTIFNNKMVESAAAKKIHSFLLHATAKKHQSYERDYQPFAVKDFVEAVINQTSPISIKDDSVYMGDQQFNYWIDGLSWNQQLSFGQLSSDQKEKLVHLLYDLQHSKEEPFSLMRVLFYNLDYNFANEGQFSKYKKGEIEWEDLICKSYIEGTTYSLINIAMRFPDKLVKIMKSNAETMKVRMTQERYERLMSLIPKTISLLQSYSFLLNEYVLKYSLPKHPDSDKRYEVFRGLDLVKKYSEKKNTSAVSSYSSEIKTAAYFAGDYKTPKTSIAMCSTNSNPKNFCELILNLWSSFADPADYQSAVVPVATPKDDNQYPVVTEA
ncbi:MAG: hypothetical protein VW397_07655, partial [Candidatus Margulisiibacteriota bacterium]